MHVQYLTRKLLTIILIKCEEGNITTMTPVWTCGELTSYIFKKTAGEWHKFWESFADAFCHRILLIFSVAKLFLDPLCSCISRDDPMRGWQFGCAFKITQCSECFRPNQKQMIQTATCSSMASAERDQRSVIVELFNKSLLAFFP